jgi:uncharacterized Fe-S center protein
MTAEVYFVDMRARSGLNLLDKVDRLFDRAGFADLISPGDLVALKIHFGERGNLAYIRPQFLRRLVHKVKAQQGKPFLTDANTLYVGSRANAVDHLETAIENGFDYSVVGAPLVIADGLNGWDFNSVEINQRHFKEVKIASAIHQADALLAVTHFKGHEITGFGGAIKNLGMGSGARSGKQMMHSDVKPRITEKDCIGCAKCVDWCPAQAMSVEEVEGRAAVQEEVSQLAAKESVKTEVKSQAEAKAKTKTKTKTKAKTEAEAKSAKIQKRARIDYDKCIGCGECTVTCPKLAIKVSWKTRPETLQEKMVEYTLGVLKSKAGKLGCISFLTNISPDCDCFGWNDAPVVADIGILASRDPVAIDQAAIDLINSQPSLANSVIGSRPQGEDIFRAVRPDIDWSPQLAYGEQVGLGSRQYKLIRI